MLTVRAGVIGWPVSHSRSPAIHLAAAENLGIDLIYERFELPRGTAVDFVRNMDGVGLRGLSITMPHKQDVIEALDDLSGDARVLDAVNCIVNDDGRLIGHNTDGEGFLFGLRHGVDVDVNGLDIVVFGAGGAARAIVLASAAAGAESVAVVNRSPDRAEQICSIVEAAHAVDVSAASSYLASADVIVNATPIGMAGTAGDQALPFEVDDLDEKAVVVDIVYDPVETQLLAAARARGLRTVGGLPMLAGQAARQFELWTGSRPSMDVLVAAAAVG